MCSQDIHIWDNSEFENLRENISEEDFNKIKLTIKNKKKFYPYEFFSGEILELLIQSIEYVRKPIM